jgi:hypothetical protein
MMGFVFGTVSPESLHVVRGVEVPASYVKSRYPAAGNWTTVGVPLIETDAG